MTDFALTALEYGVLGLCAVTLVLVAGIIRFEQKRSGFPRRGILHASYAFMVFCLALALINGYVQLQEHDVDAAREAALEQQLRETQGLLEETFQAISDYKTTLAGLDGLIDLKVESEITNPSTSPVLRAVARNLKEAMDRAKEKGLLDP
jgi:cell division protein FtsB